MIDEFQKYLPSLEARNALPYRDEINWEMKFDFPYGDASTSSSKKNKKTKKIEKVKREEM
jgi:hypothetical protein